MVFIALILVSIFASLEIADNGIKKIDFLTPTWSFVISYSAFAFEGIGVVLPIREITENKD